MCINTWSWVKPTQYADSGLCPPRPIWCYAAPPASPRRHWWHARGASRHGLRQSVGKDEVTVTSIIGPAPVTDTPSTAFETCCGQRCQQAADTPRPPPVAVETCCRQTCQQVTHRSAFETC